MLASAAQLNPLTHAKMRFIDGTFKVVRIPFIQLLRVYSFVSRSCYEANYHFFLF
ncbi:hypothetical protein NP493_113g01048 [Ridgeia piscesae]|uniref:Uncharacterized protein n=1 Tax=Ridgeia piscesae TaxID=27915 RepID=A0AAD9P6R7_RIDPI|nr:hypothetical protein NP493_113g01048 [Ridgeia piscesae]